MVENQTTEQTTENQPSEIRVDNRSYYVNQMVVLTRTGIKVGVYGTIICIFGLFIAFTLLGAITESVSKNVKGLSGPMLDSMNSINTMTHPTPLFIICLAIICGLFATLIVSKGEIVARMNYLKRKYNCANWDDTCEHLRSLGMTYPWWQNDLFWEESKDVFISEQPSTENQAAAESSDRPTFDPTWGQL